jgi:hypothetical protein
MEVCGALQRAALLPNKLRAGNRHPQLPGHGEHEVVVRRALPVAGASRRRILARRLLAPMLVLLVITLEACGGTTEKRVVQVGGACSSDSDCPSALVCIGSSREFFNGEGPAGGYCTVSCATSVEACSEFDAVCLGAGGEAWCFETCDATEEATTKCHGRPEVGCRMNGVCTPRCATDADCGLGLFCNPKSGLCSKVAVSGNPDGTHCEASSDECLGDCATIGGDFPPLASMCISGCVIGRDDACQTGSNPSGTCLAHRYPPYDAPAISENGNLGQCFQSCTKDADCLDEFEVVHCDLTPKKPSWPYGVCVPG